MTFFYPFIIAFVLIFISELGDKTQLLVLSFTTKIKTSTILLGVAFGSLFSHGIAILFGSFIGNINNLIFQHVIKIITYFSFIIFGIITLLKSDTENKQYHNTHKSMKYVINYVCLIAVIIALGELGDKTFLASIGLGIEYASYKVSLVFGAVLGMVSCDLIAIIFGKIISKKISTKSIQNISGILFIIFGLLGLLNFLSH